MKTKIIYIIITFLISTGILNSQVIRTINVTTPGTLATLIGNDKTTVTDLTLKGTINDTDFATIKQMTALQNLDMGAMNIVNGTIPGSAFFRVKMNRIILPSSLIAIGTYAFQNATLTQELLLPATLTTIGSRAFQFTTVPFLDFTVCTNLESIAGGGTFHAMNLTSDNTFNFSNCKKINWFTIQNTGDIFSGFTGRVILPDNIRRIPDSMFAGFAGSVDMPETVTEIGNSSFFRMNPRNEFRLPSNVTIIGNNAFHEAKLPGGLLLPATLTTIGFRAFLNMTVPSLDFTVCTNLESIGSATFSGINLSSDNTLNFLNCKKINWLTVQSTGDIFYGFTGRVILPDNIRRIPDSMFAGFAGSVDIPETVTEIGNSSFFRMNPSNEFRLPNTITHIGNNAFNETKLPGGLLLPTTLTTVGFRAFLSMTVPSLDFTVCTNLESIGIGAFNGINLTSDNILNFSNCNKINWLTVQNTGDIFSGFTGRVILPDNMRRIPDNMFFGFRGSVNIPESVKEIGNSSFTRMVPREDFRLPNTITHIGNNAFQEVNFPKSLILPTSLASIGTRVFQNASMPSLDFTVCSQLNVLGGESFYGLKLASDNTLNFSLCKNINWFTVTSASKAFDGFSGEVILPDGLVRIPDGMFWNFRGSVNIPESVIEIGNSSFARANLSQGLVLPNSMQKIGERAFQEATIPYIRFSGVDGDISCF